MVMVGVMHAYGEDAQQVSAHQHHKLTNLVLSYNNKRVMPAIGAQGTLFTILLAYLLKVARA